MREWSLDHAFQENASFSGDYPTWTFKGMHILGQKLMHHTKRKSSLYTGSNHSLTLIRFCPALVTQPRPSA